MIRDFAPHRGDVVLRLGQLGSYVHDVVVRTSGIGSGRVEERDSWEPGEPPGNPEVATKLIRSRSAEHKKSAFDPIEQVLVNREAIVSAAPAWIDTPFVHQASLEGAGCDCLGLIRGVWREVIWAEPGGIPAYSFDWAEARGEELMYGSFRRHLVEIAKAEIAAGDVALFRMAHHGPAKHCAIVGERDARGESLPPTTSGERPEGETGKKKTWLTLIHSRANRRVREEDFSPAWRRPTTFAYAFRFRGFS